MARQTPEDESPEVIGLPDNTDEADIEDRTRVKQRIPRTIEFETALHEEISEPDDENADEEAEGDPAVESAEELLSGVEEEISAARPAVRKSQKAKSKLNEAINRLAEGWDALEEGEAEQATDFGNEASQMVADARRLAKEEEDEDDPEKEKEREEETDEHKKEREDQEQDASKEIEKKAKETAEKPGEGGAEAAGKEAAEVAGQAAKAGASEVAGAASGTAAGAAGAAAGGTEAAGAAAAAVVTAPEWGTAALIGIGILVLFGVLMFFLYANGRDRSHLGNPSASQPRYVVDEDSMLELLALTNDAQAKKELTQKTITRISVLLARLKASIDLAQQKGQVSQEILTQFEKTRVAVEKLIDDFNSEEQIKAKQRESEQNKKGIGGQYVNTQGISEKLKNSLDTAIKELEALTKLLGAVDCNDLGTVNSNGYVKLPESASYTKTREDNFNYGRPRFICAIKTITERWHAAHPDSQILIYDVTVPVGVDNDHRTHDKGQDIDIWFQGATPSRDNNAMVSLGNDKYGCVNYDKDYKVELAVELARIVADVHKTQYAGKTGFWFVALNDSRVRDQVYPGVYGYGNFADDPANSGHCNHWHIGLYE